MDYKKKISTGTIQKTPYWYFNGSSHLDYSTLFSLGGEFLVKSLKKNKCVIALGGGAFLNKTIRDNVLKSAKSIWLDVDIKILCKRIKWTKKRPLLNVENYKSKIYKLYNKRKNIYKLADHKINCDKMSKSNIAKEIVNLYEKN